MDIYMSEMEIHGFCDGTILSATYRLNDFDLDIFPIF